MCKINWEERLFQLTKELHFKNTSDVPVLYAFIRAQEFIDEYKKSFDEYSDIQEKTKRTKPTPIVDDNEEFVEKMYALYPTKCPVQNRSLGKSHKDKARIKTLLKTYTPEQIEQVFKEEIDSKYNKTYMRNFSTFLNNFPEPNAISTCEVKKEENKDFYYNEKNELIINGVVYR